MLTAQVYGFSLFLSGSLSFSKNLTRNPTYNNDYVLTILPPHIYGYC